MKRFVAFVDSETDENIWETVEDAYLEDVIAEVQ